MPISALNFFWLPDPHDLQGIPTPFVRYVTFSERHNQSDASMPGFTRYCPNKHSVKWFSPPVENRPLRGIREKAGKVPQIIFLSLAKTMTDRRINSLEPYFPSLIWYNFLPGSACFSSGAEPCFAFSVAAGVLFWRISQYASSSPF